MTGVVISAVFAAGLSGLDHANFEVSDRLWMPLLTGLMIGCFWMLVAGIAWSMVGERRDVTVLAISNALLPILLVVLLFAVGLSPNVHGSFAMMFLFELFSLITMLSMLLCTYLRKSRINA